MARTKKNEAEEVVKEVAATVEEVVEPVVPASEDLNGYEPDGFVGEETELGPAQDGTEVEAEDPDAKACTNDEEENNAPIDAEDAPTVVKGDNVPEHLRIIEEERLPEFEVKKPVMAEKCWVPTNEFPSAIVAQKLF